MKANEEETTKKDPWELVVEAIHRMKRNGDVMRSDRLKQVMQEIDPTFDEKNLGMSKFSRFCQEASHKGLIHVTKLENGQLEVALPSAVRKDAPRPADAAASAPAAVPAPRDDDEARGRRGRRGGRGRGRDRDRAGELRPEQSPDAPGAAAAVVVPTPVVSAVPAAAAPAPAAPPAAAPAPAQHPHRHERRPAGPAVDSTIGVSGVRLTRDEAFSLVRRAVEALATGEASVMAEAVRVKARELLGRDSESLSDRNFTRILRDTHDAGAVDVRRRGDSFEVSRVEGTVSVADQLSAAEAQAKADAPPAPAVAPQPRGVGASRGLPSKGGGRGAKVPPSLLLLGVVDDTPAPAPAAPVKPAVSAADEAPVAKKGRGGRKPKADAPAKAEAAAPKAKAVRKPRAKKA